MAVIIVFLLLIVFPIYFLLFLVNKFLGKKEYKINNEVNNLIIQKTKTRVVKNICICFYILAILISFMIITGKKDSNAYVIMPVFILAKIAFIYMIIKDFRSEPMFIEINNDKISFNFKNSIKCHELINASELIFIHKPQENYSIGIIINKKELVIAHSKNKNEIIYINKVLHERTQLETTYKINRGLLPHIIKKVDYVKS